MTLQSVTRKQVDARSQLLIQICEQCGTLLAPMMATCSRCCSSQLEPIASTGTGSIVSSRVVHREVDGFHGELVPVTIAIVALDECATEPVRVRFVPNVIVDRLPVFQLCPDHCPE
ncbi:MAG: hypothetical protein EON54_23855 [Alcaligenaceae bacterium]|nr:MAG: hypothetical protein EON54_23855 [Alcaligenaceae bacterium]